MDSDVKGVLEAQNLFTIRPSLKRLKGMIVIYKI
jgi:hypothetical protein